MKAAKGARWEREFSRALSLWWTKGERDDVFWRVGGSGGRATNLAARGKVINVVGDIMAVDGDAYKLTEQFVIELKNGYGFLRIHDLFNERSHLTRWLLKLHKEAGRVNRSFMLVHRYRSSTILITSWVVLPVQPHLVVTISPFLPHIPDDFGHLFIWDLKYFFETVNPDFIRGSYEDKALAD